MKRDCSTCTFKEGSCYPSKTIFDKDKTCKSYDPDYEGYIAELEKENADLKEEINKIAFARGNLEEENAELKEYNKYLKRKRQGGIQKQYNKVAIIKQQDEHLTKAKELLKKFMKFYERTSRDCYSKDFQKTLAEAEQFISEVEK